MLGAPLATVRTPLPPGLAHRAAHQARAAGCAGQSQEGLGHVTAQVQVHPAAVDLGPVGVQCLPVQTLD